MKLKTPVSRKENLKTPSTRLSPKASFTTRQKEDSGRLSIPTRRNTSARSSFATLKSRHSLPVSSPHLKIYKKQQIIENLVRKLQDEEQLRSIIESKYLFRNICQDSLPLKNRGFDPNFSSICTNHVESVYCRPFSINYDRDQSKYLRQRVKNDEQNRALVKQSKENILAESLSLLYQGIASIPKKKVRHCNYNFGNQVAIQTQQQRNQPHRNSGKETFLTNLDSTLSILNGVSVARLR